MSNIVGILFCPNEIVHDIYPAANRRHSAVRTVTGLRAG